jgi:hypothetical protein
VFAHLPFADSRIRYLCVSALVLIPCFWTFHIQAGDLGSHLYNAWLEQLVKAGGLPGFFLTHPSTNVLFDWMLDVLWPLGSRAAERITVGISVLVFIWGAFAFLSRFSSRCPWHLLPLVAALAYGWVFQMGFFNFYLAVGLSLWALALCGNPRLPVLLLAGALFLLAWAGNPIPVLWAVAAALYRFTLPRLVGRFRYCLPAAALILLAVCGLWLRVRFPSRWTPAQLWWVSGADQFWIFGPRYVAVAGALLILCSAWVWLLPLRHGWLTLSTNLPFHLILLSAFASFVLPNAVLLPGYSAGLTYIPERLSLITAICVCALLTQIRPPSGLSAATYIMAALFFGMLFRDARACDRVEAAISRTVAELPPLARVVAPLTAPDWRIDPYTHMLDRACIGRCYSYANYEPCSAAFRVHCARRNGLIVDNYQDSFAIQSGRYVVRPRDPPLYEVFPCPSPSPEFCFQPLLSGDRLMPQPVGRQGSL